MILLLYIIVDVIRSRTRNLVIRVFFYRFIFYIFYMLIVSHLTIGGIVIPPFRDNILNVQIVPLYLIWDLYNMYQNNGLDWFFLNSLKLTFFNFIMLMPLGVYLVFLFKLKRKIKAILIMFFVSLVIEILQFSFTYLGWIMERGFNVDDIIINTLGGYIAFILCELAKNKPSQTFSVIKKSKLTYNTIRRVSWCETFLAQMKCGHTILVKVRQFWISKTEGLYRGVV